MLKKIISKGFNGIIVGILLISFILVGTPLNENTIIYSMCVIGVGILWGTYKTIRKEKIFTDKIDLVLLVFYLMPLIPLLFNTYNNLEDTLGSLVKNVSLFVIYLLLKDKASRENKKELIINILLAGLSILSFFGFDEMLGQTIYKYMRYIGIPNVVNYESRMFSTLCYANSFAVLMGCGIYLALKNMKDNKNILINSLLVYIFTLSLILTYSRSVWLLFLLMFGIYLLFSNDRVYDASIILTNVILSLIGAKIINIFIEGKINILAWISILAFAGVSYLITTKLNELKEKMSKIKLSTCIYALIGLVILMLIIYIVGIQLIVPLNIFARGKTNEQIRYKLYDITANTEYTVKLDIEAKSLGRLDNTYTIEIAEENKYYDTIATHKLHLGSFNGTKEFNFKTSEDTVAMVIFFKSNNENLQDGLKIKNININGKKKGLNYLYISANLVEKIESFSLKNKSVWERFVYHKDGIKIIKINPLTGSGANGWRYNYTEVQEYVYSSYEPHSHIIQLAIDNGIIAGAILIIIISYTIIVNIKKKRLDLEFIAFMLLNIHSLIDFNMSFYVVNIIWISLLSVIMKDSNKEDVESGIKEKINAVINILYVTVEVLVLILAILSYGIKSENELIVNKAKELIKQELYDESLANIKVLEKDKKYKGHIYGIIQMLDYTKLNNDSLEYIYSLLSNEEIVANSEQNIMLNRITENIMLKDINLEYKKKYAELIVRNNNDIVSNIKNYKANRLSKKNSRMLLIEQEKIYINAKNILSKK